MHAQHQKDNLKGLFDCPSCSSNVFLLEKKAHMKQHYVRFMSSILSLLPRDTKRLLW